MARENVTEKSRRYLCEGRVILQEVDRRHVVGTCRGDGAVYRCTYDAGYWQCSCPARTDRCAHLLAIRSVVAVDHDRQFASEHR